MVNASLWLIVGLTTWKNTSAEIAYSVADAFATFSAEFNAPAADTAHSWINSHL